METDNFRCALRHVLESLLFNIYFYDVFFETPSNIDFAGYADDTTPHTSSLNVENVLYNL